jgi:hypothetical protein
MSVRKCFRLYEALQSFAAFRLFINNQGSSGAEGTGLPSQASRVDQMWSRPQAGHFMGERISGSFSNVAASISMPVESSRPVLGHLTMTKLIWYSLLRCSGNSHDHLLFLRTICASLAEIFATAARAMLPDKKRGR